MNLKSKMFSQLTMNSQQMRKEKITTLKRSQAGYAAAITRKLHTLENPMLDDTEFEQVATSIEGIHSSFAITHDELMLNLAYDWEEAEKARELYCEVEAQMKGLYHMIEARKADSELVRLGDLPVHHCRARLLIQRTHLNLADPRQVLAS